LRGKVFSDADGPVPDAPQTMRQNWMPFFTFFLRRIIFYWQEGMNVSNGDDELDILIASGDAAEIAR
jgi:hypothetical protein